MRERDRERERDRGKARDAKKNQTDCNRISVQPLMWMSKCVREILEREWEGNRKMFKINQTDCNGIRGLGPTFD